MANIVRVKAPRGSKIRVKQTTFASAKRKSKKVQMNLENRATKVMLKSMPAYMAEELLDLYKIKKPYKEILFATCVKDMPQFEAMKHLAEQGINLGYRTFLRKQAKALEMFRVAHIHYKNR